MSARWLKTAALARVHTSNKSPLRRKVPERACDSFAWSDDVDPGSARAQPTSRLATKAFTTRSIEALRERIEAIAHELIDEVEGKGSMDVIADFAHKLPVEVICDMLGIPEAHRERFTRGSQVSGRLIDPTPMSDEELARANERTRFSTVLQRPV